MAYGCEDDNRFVITDSSFKQHGDMKLPSNYTLQLHMDSGFKLINKFLRM